MLVLRLGLTVAALGFVIASVASYRAGYPAEVALVRGLLSFMALSFVAYLGELVVVTSPLPNTEASEGEGRDGPDGIEIESADDQGQGSIQSPDEPARLPESTESLPAA
jgi:hypothetical protein